MVKEIWFEKGKGICPWSKRTMKSKFRQILSLSHNMFWVYVGAVQTDCESLLEGSHKVSMDHFNTENF